MGYPQELVNSITVFPNYNPGMDTALLDSIRLLLKQTRATIHHEKEMEDARGEAFNIYSILELSTKENKTHSNFLRELLDQYGSHNLGSRPLLHFLNTVNYTGQLDLKASFANVEHSIGKIDHEKKTGGRIDIYISDNSNTITIENKIHAGDQKDQIVRYKNHNKNRNSVYYLTLDGIEPEVFSKGELVSGQDFFLISYKNHIHDWLELCLRDAYDKPILRESIKQYQILIRKLTNRMDNEFQNKFAELLISEIDAGFYISENFSDTIGSLQNRFRESVKARLARDFISNGIDCNVEIGDSIQKQYAQLWIQGKKGSKLQFGIETFNGDTNANRDGKLFVGLYGEVLDQSEELGFTPIRTKWAHHELIKSHDGEDIHLRDSTFLMKLLKEGDSEFQMLVEKVVTTSIRFIQETNSLLPDNLKVY